VSNEPVDPVKDTQESKDSMRDEFNGISVAFENSSTVWESIQNP